MASVSAQMPIIRLRDGIENGQGRGQVINNINACVSVSDYVRTTLGGMDELVVDREDKTTISNDGATIMNMFDIVYPAAKIMSDTAKNQDDDVGDGTSSDTSLVFLDKTKKCSQYSRKVFIGGLPFDATEEDINASFEHFGPMSIDWPRRHSSSDGSSPGGSPSGSPDRRQTSGYVFLIYRKESSVHRLLEGCKVDSGRYFMLMSTRNSCRKPVQVRPWRLSDFVYLPTPVATLDPRNTVFIGGVPRPTRAVDIVEAFEKKYGRVIYASI
uniref:RRM domain-containing protein n=1 Tax=Panagrolaimus sp. ES5 TaxID=591445 RepID=A0AC34F0V8_9BILA